MRTNRNLTSSKSGIQTILAALLMVVIVVVAAVMVYAWSTGLLGTLLVNPNNNKEGPLTLDTNAAFPTNNNVTFYIRNSGTLGVTLTSFYITDSSNNVWQALSWTGPNISPNAVQTVTINIPLTTGGTNCYSNTGSGYALATCSFTGSGGFGGATSGNSAFGSGSYTLKVITSRNNPFTMTFTH